VHEMMLGERPWTLPWVAMEPPCALADHSPKEGQLVHRMPGRKSRDPIWDYSRAAAIPPQFWFRAAVHQMQTERASLSPRKQGLPLIKQRTPAHFCWAMLRLGGSTIHETFAALETCQDASMGD
jgi:hypothetical protein